MFLAEHAMSPARRDLVEVFAGYLLSVHASLQVAGREAKALSHRCECGQARIRGQREAPARRAGPRGRGPAAAAA